MVITFGEAQVEEERIERLLSAWSDVVVGRRPAGLVECFLMRGKDSWQIAAIWETQAALDDAHRQEVAHPAFVVFDAADAEPSHSVLELVGRF